MKHNKKFDRKKGVTFHLLPGGKVETPAGEIKKYITEDDLTLEEDEGNGQEGEGENGGDVEHEERGDEQDDDEIDEDEEYDENFDITDLGLPDDGYDYMQHIRKVSGQGVWVPAASTSDDKHKVITSIIRDDGRLM